MGTTSRGMTSSNTLQPPHGMRVSIDDCHVDILASIMKSNRFPEESLLSLSVSLYPCMCPSVLLPQQRITQTTQTHHLKIHSTWRMHLALPPSLVTSHHLSRRHRHPRPHLRPLALISPSLALLTTLPSPPYPLRFLSLHRRVFLKSPSASLLLPPLVRPLFQHLTHRPNHRHKHTYNRIHIHLQPQTQSLYLSLTRRVHCHQHSIKAVTCLRAM
jgi:hypothetical protein